MIKYMKPIQTKSGKNRFERLMHKFVHDEMGAITVDHIVLTAGVVVIALLAVSNYSSGAKNLANDRKQVLSSYRGISSSATNPTYASTLITGGSGGGGTSGTGGGGTTGTGGGTGVTGTGTTGTGTTGTGTTGTGDGTGVTGNGDGTDTASVDGTDNSSNNNADDDSSSGSSSGDKADNDSSSGSTSSDNSESDKKHSSGDDNSKKDKKHSSGEDNSDSEQSSFNDLHDYDYLTGGNGHDVQFA